MKQIIGRKVYDTETATLIADNEFADGSNRLNTGRVSYLYKTQKDNFFVFHQTIWQGEHDSIETVSVDEAKDKFESLRKHAVSWEEAFGEKPEEA